jgi:hypothetical protein
MPKPPTGELEKPIGYVALNCPIKPCLGEKCMNWGACAARKDGRDYLKTEQTKVV